MSDQADTITVTEFHPLADLFPMMAGEDFEKFAQDIADHGQRAAAAAAVYGSDLCVFNRPGRARPSAGLASGVADFFGLFGRASQDGRRRIARRLAVIFLRTYAAFPEQDGSWRSHK
jgi:hypothetical protein